MSSSKEQEANGVKFADSTSSSSASDNQKDGEAPDRAAWGGQLEFILTCVGYAVGLGNVWRFPYLCYSNGGAAFIIPYIIMLALVGLPLFYMELCIGQFASLGPLAVWKFSPVFKGLGFASVMVSLLISIYYNVIIAICMYFLFKSMAAEVPWTNCNNAWNTVYCQTLGGLSADSSNSSNVTVNLTTKVVLNGTIKTPSEEFFYNEVLKLTGSAEEAGGMRWELVGCLFFCWVIVAGVLIKGISSLGKVVYFTALFPYVLLTILLVNGALLEGSWEGVRFYIFNPQWERLSDAKVWSDAAVQIFYSLGVASGGLMAMASYNKFNNNVLRDSLIVPIVNCCTSIYAGFVIFSVLGYMAHLKQVDVADVAAQGPGLTFVVYPEALSTMPLPTLWSILFFFMMVTLGFSSEFSMMECVLTAFLDEYPQWLKTSRKREITFRLTTCFVCFLCGLPMVTHGGFYILNLLDNYVGGFPLIIVGIGELISINWVYGFRRFTADIKIMLGRPAPIYFMIMWCGFSTLLMTATLVFTAMQYKPLEFQGYVYTPAFSALGWMTVVFCVMFIPLCALYACYQNGLWEMLKASSSPESDWGPASPSDRVGTSYEHLNQRDEEEAQGEGSGGAINHSYVTSDTELPRYSDVSKL